MAAPRNQRLKPTRPLRVETLEKRALLTADVFAVGGLALPMIDHPTGGHQEAIAVQLRTTDLAVPPPELPLAPEQISESEFREFPFVYAPPWPPPTVFPTVANDTPATINHESQWTFGVQPMYVLIDPFTHSALGDLNDRFEMRDPFGQQPIQPDAWRGLELPPFPPRMLGVGLPSMPAPLVYPPVREMIDRRGVQAAPATSISQAAAGLNVTSREHMIDQVLLASFTNPQASLGLSPQAANDTVLLTDQPAEYTTDEEETVTASCPAMGGLVELRVWSDLLLQTHRASRNDEIWEIKQATVDRVQRREIPHFEKNSEADMANQSSLSHEGGLIAVAAAVLPTTVVNSISVVEISVDPSMGYFHGFSVAATPGHDVTRSQPGEYVTTYPTTLAATWTETPAGESPVDVTSLSYGGVIIIGGIMLSAEVYCNRARLPKEPTSAPPSKRKR